jgi:hypothetical protein
MITRELADADRDAVLELLRTARSGCTFPGLRAEAHWRRWRLTSTILGTFDDAGELFTLRVLDPDPMDATRARLRAACHRAPLAADGYSEAMKRSLQGHIAWLRQRGIERIIIAVKPETLDAWATVRAHVAATVGDGALELRTEDLEDLAR